MSSSCWVPLPYMLVGRKVPRKVALRTRGELCIATLIFVLLVILFRSHHASSERSTKKTKWPVIIPQHDVEELEVIPRNIYDVTKEDVMYCYIPKNACSRFKALLRKREGFADWKDLTKVHGKNGLQRSMWLSHNRAIERLKDPNFKKFVVIFWEKHLRKECPGMIGSMEMPTEGPLLSLEDFLKCLLSTDNVEESNEHWRPQSELCGLDYVKYDRYLHLESLPEDVEELMDTLNWHENTTTFQMNRNPIYSRNLESYFSRESVNLALEYYAEDFEVLEYSREPSGNIDFYSVFDITNYQPNVMPPVDFQPQHNTSLN